MKLKELLSDINAKDEVVATYDKNNGIVYIYKSGSEDTSDSFFAFDDDIKSLNQVSKIYDYLDTVSLDTLQFILNKINEYIKTPILDRMGDDGYWVVDYPAEICGHNNYNELKTIQHCYGGLA